jgi:CTD kinase subunit beta
MAPLSSQSRVGSSLFGAGPHQSDVRVAKQYIFHQQLTGKLVAIGANPTREDQFRLQGVQWINEVRCALQLYVSAWKGN